MGLDRLDTRLFAQIIDSFLTGSHAYGKPKNSSDVDLCVLINSTVSCEACFWSIKNEQDNTPRFGRLNILQFRNRERFERWRQVTLELMGRTPVTREEAIKAFKAAGFDRYPKDRIEEAATDDANGNGRA